MNSTAYTSTPADILTASEELTALLFASDIYITYTRAKNEMETDKEARRLISEFNAWKDRYEEVQRFGKYHPDYKMVSKEIRLKKREMDVHPAITAFKKAEKDLETLLNEISGEIAGAVSPNIKVPTGNPFFDNASCGSGGCGSGGSCGCSA